MSQSISNRTGEQFIKAAKENTEMKKSIAALNELYNTKVDEIEEDEQIEPPLIIEGPGYGNH